MKESSNGLRRVIVTFYIVVVIVVLGTIVMVLWLIGTDAGRHRFSWPKDQTEPVETYDLVKR